MRFRHGTLDGILGKEILFLPELLQPGLGLYLERTHLEKNRGRRHAEVEKDRSKETQRWRGTDFGSMVLVLEFRQA